MNLKTRLLTNCNAVRPGWIAIQFLCLMLALGALTGCDTTQAGKPATPASVEQAHKEMIILREGDMLKISFPGSPSFDTVQQIRRDGKINMELVGEVDAAGLTPEELQEKLIKLYATQLTSKEVTVTVQSSAFPVFVTGQVMHPGKIMSDHPLTALEAVMEAGGFVEATANMKAVQVIRLENGTVKNFTVNLKLALQGKASQPFYLKPSDILYVPERFSMF
jgi:polysaccharide export outer membrane protein